MEKNRLNAEDLEDIVSSSEASEEFEDVFSSSKQPPRKNSKETLDFNSFSNYNEDAAYYYRKKKRGFAKVMSDTAFKIRSWWKGLKKGKKAALISVTAFLLVLISLFVWAFSIFDYDYRPISTNPEDLGIVGGQIDEDIINVALFGIDTRGLDTFEGNADSIMILSLNTKSKKIKIFSVVRDTLVRIEHSSGKVEYNKINSAYAKGGPQLAVKTLNQNFGLDIMKYATVNFFGMADIIDAVGGIEATITKDELYKYPMYDINYCIKEICKAKGISAKSHLVSGPGKQHLDGVQAVAYARIRMGKNVWGTNNDFGRSDRQRYVMEQLFNKAKKMKANQFLPFAEALCPCVQTNYKPTEIASLADSILLHSPTFEQYRIPVAENDNSFLMPSPKGSFGSVVYYDLDYAKRALHSIIYDNTTMEGFIAENPVEKNDWYGAIVGTKKPSAQKPSTDKPSTDKPSTDEPSTDKPSTDEPSTDEPSTDKPSTDEPSTDKPSTDEPSTDEPSTDKPSTDEPSTDEPSTDKPSTDKPSTDEPSTDKPSTDEPSTDEPSTEKPTVEDSSEEDKKPSEDKEE